MRERERERKSILSSECMVQTETGEGESIHQCLAENVRESFWS